MTGTGEDPVYVLQLKPHYCGVTCSLLQERKTSYRVQLISWARLFSWCSTTPAGKKCL